MYLHRITYLYIFEIWDIPSLFLFIFVLFTSQFLYKLIKALGSEPGAAEFFVQTDPLSYVGHNFSFTALIKYYLILIFYVLSSFCIQWGLKPEVDYKKANPFHLRCEGLKNELFSFIFNFLFHHSVSNQINQIESWRKHRCCAWVQKRVCHHKGLNSWPRA